MKKFIYSLLSIMFLVLLVSCGKDSATTPDKADTKAGKKKVLGIVLPNATHGFLGESIKHAEAEAKALAESQGFEYKFLTSSEASEQNNQIDTLINEKVDAIVLWPHNGDELRSAAQAVVDAKIPLIVYDRLINNFTPTATVMGDNIGIGEMTGTYLNKYFAIDLQKGEIQVLEFMGDNSTVPQQRQEGYLKTADKKIKIVQSFNTNWQRQKAQEQMENFLNTSKPEDIEKIKAVITQDDEIEMGVLDAINAYKGPAKLDIRLITGVSGRRENLDTFEKEKIDQVTYAFSPAMVREAVKLGADALNGKTLEKSYIIKTVEIDKSTLNDFRNSDIYKIRYSIQ
ncbi:MAG: substrate-binding domain-containing protein [Sebaldella sp.]|nr:substrate-binding domain-containing protein [Sebaldella sp.]